MPSMFPTSMDQRTVSHLETARWVRKRCQVPFWLLGWGEEKVSGTFLATWVAFVGEEKVSGTFLATWVAFVNVREVAG